MNRIFSALSGALSACLVTTAFAQQPAPTAPFQTRAQILLRTGEDSLQTGYNESRTVISGYGSAYFQRDFNLKKNLASLERVVLFIGHQFNRKFSVFTELELENAVVTGGEAKGEIAVEQAYVRYNLSPQHYVVAGLFIPRIGILNENHLPVNFNGVERPLTEQLIIPATWRELGVCWYGTFGNLQLTGGLMNGLSAQNMEHGDGLRSGRAEGALAGANNMAVTASAAYTAGNFRFQLSGYAGGTNSLRPRLADSLHLDGGAFGLPLYLAEADVQYRHKAFAGKALSAFIAYPDAGSVNAAFAGNLPTQLHGSYAELSYDLLYAHSLRTNSSTQLLAFARCEAFDLNAAIPAPPRAIYDGTLKQSQLIAGFNLLPIPGLTFKADVRLQHTGPQNKELTVNPAPNALPYQQGNTFLNVGVGYSF